MLEFTVAIATWNCAKMIDHTLLQMRRLLFPSGVERELLVVNNNCTDQTDAIIAKREKDLPVRRLFEPTPGLASARNRAASNACRRTALADVGGFDSWFGPAALYNAEELDLLARLSAKGWAGAYDPRPTVYHHHGRKVRPEVRRLTRSYESGRGAYFGVSELSISRSGLGRSEARNGRRRFARSRPA